MRNFSYLVGFIALIGLGACNPQSAAFDEGQMAGMAAALTNFSPKVDVEAELMDPECVVGSAPREVPQEAINKALDINLNIKKKFADLHVKVKARRVNCQTVVLLCTDDKPPAHGLLEDAGCNLRSERPPEKRLWKTTPEAPCAFTMEVDAACKLLN